ncbi:MAG: hypothetical protein ACLU4J_20655 [Butyricimonas paravirosa]
MRKLLFILVVVLIVSNNVSAQQKPKKGSFGTEIQSNPFDQDGKTFQLDGLKFRYFICRVIRLKLESIQLKTSSQTRIQEEEIKPATK